MRPIIKKKRIDPRYFLHETTEKYTVPEAFAIHREISQLLGRDMPMPDETYTWYHLSKSLIKTAGRAQNFWAGGFALEGYVQQIGAIRECYAGEVNKLKPIVTLNNVKAGLDDLQGDPNYGRGTAGFDEEFKVYIKANLDVIKNTFLATAIVNKEKLKLYPIVKNLADKCVPRDRTPLVP
jgi:hypothetical protein